MRVSTLKYMNSVGIVYFLAVFSTVFDYSHTIFLFLLFVLIVGIGIVISLAVFQRTDSENRTEEGVDCGKGTHNLFGTIQFPNGR